MIVYLESSFWRLPDKGRQRFLQPRMRLSSHIIITTHLHMQRYTVGLVGWLCFTSHRQRGRLETAPPSTVPCEGREAR